MARTTSGARGSKKPAKQKAETLPTLRPLPKGTRLTVPQQHLRDSLMLQRKAQGWNWPAIAEEAGVSERAARDAVKKLKESSPDLMNMDPVAIVEQLVEGFQASIGDFERMALAYADKHPSAAVGAKKAADDARRNVAEILQATGKLPRELGTIRGVIEVRAVIAVVAQAVFAFREDVSKVKLPAKERAKLDRAAKKLDKSLASAGGAVAAPG